MLGEKEEKQISRQQVLLAPQPLLDIERGSYVAKATEHHGAEPARLPGFLPAQSGWCGSQVARWVSLAG